MPSTKQAPIRMIRGHGDAAVTHYSCGAVDKAIHSGRAVIVIRNGKEVRSKARRVHREDPFSVYGDTHECAGDGKYISLKAFSDDRQRIKGAQHINPYLREDGPYYSIIEAFKKSIGVRCLSQLSAKVAKSFDAGIHLLWEGKRTAEGFLVGAASAFMTVEEVWRLSLKVNSELQKVLRESKSGRKGVRFHKSPREKFAVDLDVLRRATCVVNVATGEREYRGGKTPYSKPLEQMGFAIDKRFLTYGVDANGNELAQYYYRMVIGRSEPYSLSKTSWAYEGLDSSVAFKDAAARRAVMRRQTA